MTHTLINLLPSALAVATIGFLWLMTTFVLEYGSLLGLSRFLKKAEWEKFNNEASGEGKYPYFLRGEYPCFLTRLLGCPYCLLTFVSMCISLFDWQDFGLLIQEGLCRAGLAIFIHSVFQLLHKKVYNH